MIRECLDWLGEWTPALFFWIHQANDCIHLSKFGFYPSEANFSGEIGYFRPVETQQLPAPRAGRLFLWHLLFCLFYYDLRVILDVRQTIDWSEYTDPLSWGLSLAGYGIFFLYTLLPYWVLRRFYFRPAWQTTLAMIVGAIGCVAIRYLLEEVVGPATIGFRNYPSNTSFWTVFIDNIYYLLLHGATGAIAFLLETTRWREQERQQLLVENQRTELAFLRSQINPHFLFNTLNNIYSLVFRGSDRGLRSIERLTKMLRYGLYEKAESVPLQREIDHLVNFIELEKMRYDFDLDLEISLPSQKENGPPAGAILVPPLLLITFVENAFKHGDLREPLCIELKAAEGTLAYRVSNHIKKKKQKDRVGGIGLENLKRRLELLYGPRNHTLEVKSEGSVFLAQLQISLT